MRPPSALPLFLLSPLAVASPLSVRGAIEDCLTSSGVPYDVKDSADWKADVAPFNTRLAYVPAAIAVPKTVKHVQDAVACGVKVGLKINPKSGGHGYASFGLGGENGHLVIELDRMSKVTLDTKTNVASIEGGSRLGHVFTELWKQGKRAISHGTCPG
jgi:FAD/FMN-containing dehydrogenase